MTNKEPLKSGLLHMTVGLRTGKEEQVEQQHYLGPADRDTEEPPSG